MLTTEQILKNTTKYFQTATKYEVMNDKFMTFLGEAFIKAPATTQKDQFNAFEGGLIDYILTVTKYAVIFNDALPETERVSQASLIKVCLLHQIGKAHMFVPNTSEWHKNNLGKIYDFNQDLISMRVGERSLFYAMSNGIVLTEEEYAAIIMFDKSDDKMAEYHNTMLGDLLKTAVLFATKNKKKA